MYESVSVLSKLVSLDLDEWPTWQDCSTRTRPGELLTNSDKMSSMRKQKLPKSEPEERSANIHSDWDDQIVHVGAKITLREERVCKKREENLSSSCQCKNYLLESLLRDLASRAVSVHSQTFAPPGMNEVLLFIIRHGWSRARMFSSCRLAKSFIILWWVPHFLSSSFYIFFFRFWWACHCRRCPCFIARDDGSGRLRYTIYGGCLNFTV